MIDKFTIKELLTFIIFLNIGGLAGIYACIAHHRTELKDHAQLYKAIMKISGDLPH